jgi:hypothetical protein
LLVAGEVAVTIEMVRRNIEQYGGARPESFDALELEGGNFEDGEIKGLADKFEGGEADVAGGTSAKAGGSGHRLDESDDGGFSICAGHGDDRNRKRAGAEFDVAPDRGLAAKEARGGNSGARDDEVKVIKVWEASADP